MYGGQQITRYAIARRLIAQTFNTRQLITRTCKPPEHSALSCVHVSYTEPTFRLHALFSLPARRVT